MLSPANSPCSRQDPFSNLLTARLPLSILFVFLIKKIFFNVYLFLRQRETGHEGGGGSERERETQNLEQAPGSELSARSPTRGSNSQTARS